MGQRAGARHGPEEPPFEDDEDLEAFFASRNVQTPLQRFDQLQADNAIAAAKKVLDEKEAERLRLIDKAAADAAVDAARKAILARLDAEEAAAAAAPAPQDVRDGRGAARSCAAVPAAGIITRAPVPCVTRACASCRYIRFSPSACRPSARG